MLDHESPRGYDLDHWGRIVNRSTADEIVLLLLPRRIRPEKGWVARFIELTSGQRQDRLRRTVLILAAKR